MSEKKDTQHNYIVDGFVFHNRRDAEQAQKEYDGIKYLKSKSSLENPEKLLQVYSKVLSQHLFETPVGIHFLKELQDQLKANPKIMDDAIEPIEAGEIPREAETEARRAALKEKAEERKHELQKLAAKANATVRFRVSLILNVILILAVAGMFYVASTTNSPNILNYEDQLIDKYEDWEQDLEQRETTVKEYEEKYGIDSEE